MSIVQRIMMFGASTVIGFGQGFQPVCGFNFGAGLYQRVRQGFWFCIKLSLVFLTAVSALMFIFAPEMISWFQSDAEVIRYGTLALRFQCISFPAHSWIVMSNMMEQSIGRTVSATFLSAARQGVFFIPAILLLNYFLGLTGVQAAQAVADLLTLVCAIPIHIYVLKTMEPRKTNTL
jgi:Na+-driven multidrug efflux pump